MRASSAADSSPGTTVVLVTIYPQDTEEPPEGVASYARGLAPGLHAAGVSVEVWAERGLRGALPADAGEFTVCRFWRRGPWAGLDLWRHLRRVRPGILHAQMEYFIFGGPGGYASVLSFLTVARRRGWRVVVTLHQVVGLKDLTRGTARGLGLTFPLFLLRWLLRTSVRYLCAVAHRVIVHEAVFHRRLIDDYGVVGSHVHVVPHGVVPAVISNGGPGEKTLLVFGYLAWYKGVDIILRAFQQIAAEFSDWQLIIAGGPHPRMKARRRGARLLGELQDLAVPAVRQIEFTGAVRDTKLPALFSNAGICLFPYRLLFSSSGPLGLALAYGRPVILSEALRPLLPEWPHWSVNSPEAWAGSLRRLMADEGLRARASTLARAEAAARTWSVVARETAEVYRLAVDSRHRPHESV